MKQIILSIVTASTLLFTACTPTNITPVGTPAGSTTPAAVSAATTITIKGKHIVTTCGDTIILKGVNYAPYGWGWNNSENLFPEIVKSGANSVRLVWYKANSGPAYSNLALLDSALARCIRYKMIPILELHDETCNNNGTSMVATANWYNKDSSVNSNFHLLFAATAYYLQPQFKGISQHTLAKYGIGIRAIYNTGKRSIF